MSVTEIQKGDEVFLLEYGEAARHTGIAIDETIKEY
jgi:3-dehydroquinate synthase class II